MITTLLFVAVVSGQALTRTLRRRRSSKTGPVTAVIRQEPLVQEPLSA